MYTALTIRDGGCRFPGCERSAKWTHGHHLRHWTKRGPTSLDNLVLLCSFHPHRSHQPGWSLKLLPDATLHVTRPDGTVTTSHPRPQTLANDP